VSIVRTDPSMRARVVAGVEGIPKRLWRRNEKRIKAGQRGGFRKNLTRLGTVSGLPRLETLDRSFMRSDRHEVQAKISKVAPA
jgi:hypothetical protein